MAKVESRVVPVFSGVSSAYREWEVRVNCVDFCIVQEDDEWTLLANHGDTLAPFWLERVECVDTFLARHNLILGE